MAAESEHLRTEGNVHFRLGKFLTVILAKRKHLWIALDCYKAGLAAALTARDRSFCCKNTAVAHKELGLMEWAEGHRNRAWGHLHHSLEGYCEAWRHASAWRAAPGHAAEALEEVVQWSQRFVPQFSADLRAMYTLTLSSETDEKLVDNLGRLCGIIGRFEFSEAVYLEVAGNIFIDHSSRLLRLSISLDKGFHYQRAYRYIADMNFPIEEAERLLMRDMQVYGCLKRELATLREDQRIQEVVFHSRIELERGKSFLQNLGDQGPANMADEALLGMDHLKAALNLISEDGVDIVLEAEVCSCIGNLCLSFFNAESSAEKYLKRCIELVLCYLSGDRETGCRNLPWFGVAERCLRDLQMRQAKRRDDERLAELEASGIMAEIKEHFERGNEHFLKHVYEKYPPRVSEGRPAREMPEAKKPMKKRLMIALAHYHPDKVEDKTDRRWYYTCEEITKYLNRFYETTKG